MRRSLEPLVIIISLWALLSACDSGASGVHQLPGADTADVTEHDDVDVDDPDSEVDPDLDVDDDVPVYYDVDDDFETVEYDGFDDLSDVVDPGDVVDDVGDLGEESDVPPEDDVVAPPEEPEEPDPVDPVVRSTTLGVLHWNIAGSKENGCRPNAIRRAVMRFVKNAPRTIDFITLNEVCRAQYDEIKRALANYWSKNGSDKFSAFQAFNDKDRGTAIFSRRNIRDVTRTKVGSDQYGDRYLLCARQTGRRVRVCGVHLSPADSKARDQLLRVLNRLELFWENNRDSVIIGGDFNLVADDPGMNKIYAAGANTPNNPGNTGRYRELDDNDPAHCKGYGERSLQGTTGGPCNKGRKIDFFFARAGRIVNGEYSADTLDIPDDCTGKCSDHRAVRGRVKLKFRTD